MWRTFNGLRRGAFRLIFETLSQKNRRRSAGFLGPK
jgi:hypothetical protein